MKKYASLGLLAILLSGCSAAGLPNAKTSPLAGEWICDSVPTKDRTTFDRLDHMVLNADGTASMRGISGIKNKVGQIRYLVKAKSTWHVKDNQLVFDFIERSMVPAHSKNVAQAIKRDKTLQQYEKAQLDDFYCPCTDHVELPIKLNSDNEFVWGDNIYSVCRKVDSSKLTKEMKLLDKFFKN